MASSFRRFAALVVLLAVPISASAGAAAATASVATASAATASAATAPAEAAAIAPQPAGSPQTYVYAIEHPSYGKIGTYTDVIDRNGNDWQIVNQVRVAVRFLGIVVHREEADRRETWRNGRLVAFHSVTTVNGSVIEVTGEARPEGFIVTSPTGTAVAPHDVLPSDPWAARTGMGVMMSTKTGRLQNVEGLGGETVILSINGAAIPTRYYEFTTDKHQEVWLDEHGIPVRFRSRERGALIDFELVRPPAIALGAVPRS
jgi:hypothetical protein